MSVLRRAVLLAGLLGIAAGAGSPGPARGEPVAVHDFRGKALSLAAPARRIVCLIESALSGIFMLGEAQRVVGVATSVYRGDVFPYYAALDERIGKKTLPAPGNWDFVSIEGVLALRPDLVILWAQQSEAIAALEERGIPVFGVFIRRLEDVYREIEALGALTGNPARAREVVDFTRSEIERLRGRAEALPRERRPSVYFMWAQGDLETSCGGSTVQDLIELAGGRNVCEALEAEHAIVNLERLIAWNPQVIVLWPNERRDPADILRDPRWRSIAAVREGRVHELPEVFLCDLWTLKFPYPVKLLHRWLYPGEAGGIDAAREKGRMLRALYGRSLP